MNNRFVLFDPDNLEHMYKFKDFYDNVFSTSFPKDEIGEFTAYLDILRDSIPEIYTYHLMFTEEDNKFIACYIFMRIVQLGVIISQFSCVDKKYRGLGLSTQLMRYAHSKYEHKWLFCDIEDSNTTNRSIWAKFGFKKIPVTYVQLPLGSYRTYLTNMILCAKPKDGVADTISSDLVKRLVWCYYRYSQFCNDPDKCKHFLKIKEECDSVSEFKLENLV